MHRDAKSLKVASHVQGAPRRNGSQVTNSSAPGNGRPARRFMQTVPLAEAFFMTCRMLAAAAPFTLPASLGGVPVGRCPVGRPLARRLHAGEAEECGPPFQGRWELAALRSPLAAGRAIRLPGRHGRAPRAAAAPSCRVPSLPLLRHTAWQCPRRSLCEAGRHPGDQPVDPDVPGKPPEPADAPPALQARQGRGEESGGAGSGSRLRDRCRRAQNRHGARGRNRTGTPCGGGF